MDVETLKNQHPQVTLLDANDTSSLEHYLRTQNWLRVQETISSVTKAGEGNMNYTLRVATVQQRPFPMQRTFIVKQARPWVEKYPQMKAPWDRILQEAKFYTITAKHSSIAQAMPHLIGVDSVSRVAIFEDLGEASDLSSLYQEGRSLTISQLETLIQWLSKLHGLSSTQAQRQALRNRDMRALNHEHIFILPFRSVAECPETTSTIPGSDLDALTPGLGTLAAEIREDALLAKAIARLGQHYYLKDGPVLLHGDFFPGSWLDTPSGVRVIDPEFAFFGAAEFDVGVFLAHLVLARQPEALIEQLVTTYLFSGYYRDLSPDVVIQIAGSEILRRLIGVAQLPLNVSLCQKRKWITAARAMVLEPQSMHNKLSRLLQMTPQHSPSDSVGPQSPR